MTHDEAVRIILDFIESKFPKTCSCCNRVFADLRDYIFHTTHVGMPISYDIKQGNWRPGRPVGTFALANCSSCGTTLSINSLGLKLTTLWQLMRWARGETRKRKISIEELLDEVRTEIEAQVASGGSDHLPENKPSVKQKRPRGSARRA